MNTTLRAAMRSASIKSAPINPIRVFIDSLYRGHEDPSLVPHRDAGGELQMAQRSLSVNLAFNDNAAERDSACSRQLLVITAAPGSVKAPRANAANGSQMFAAHWLGAGAQYWSVRRRLMAALRASYRVLGMKSPRGLGLLGVAAAAGLVAVTPVAASDQGIFINGSSVASSCTHVRADRILLNDTSGETAATPSRILRRDVSNCDPSNARTQTNRVLFYGTGGYQLQPTSGSLSLSLGGELNVNSGFLGLGDRSTDNDGRRRNNIRIGDATTTVNTNTFDAMAIGIGASAGTEAGIAIGRNASTPSGNSRAAVAIGESASATNTGVAVGFSASAPQVGVAIGMSAAAAGDRGTALGTNTSAAGERGTALGANASAAGERATSVGAFATSGGAAAFAGGRNSQAYGRHSIAIGRNATVGNSNSTAGGRDEVGSAGDSGIAIGFGSTTSANFGVAIGQGAVSQHAHSVALGSNSVTGNDPDVAAAVPYGQVTLAGQLYNFAGGNPQHVVSVGSEAEQRQIINVAAGRISAGSTDAVNGSQLFAAYSEIGKVSRQAGALEARDAAQQAQIDELIARPAGGADVANIAQAMGVGVTEDGKLAMPVLELNSPGQGTEYAENLLGGIKALDAELVKQDQALGSLAGAVIGLADDVARNADGVQTNATALATLESQLEKGEIGLVQQNADTRAITVAKDTDGARVDMTGTDGVRTVAGLKDAALTADSTEAVTGAQLKATNDQLASVDGRVTQNTQDIAKNAGDIAQNAAELANAKAAADAAKASADAAQGTANSALTAAGTAQRAADEAKAAAGSASSQLAGIGPEETVIDRIKAVGESIAAALGGGATAADDGTLGAPAYEVAAINADGTVAAPTTHNNAGAAISALGDSIGTVNSRVDGLADDSLLWNEALGAFDASHGDQSTSKIANVAAGVSDTDAVNVSQLDAVSEVADAAQSAATTAQTAAEAAQGTATTALTAANSAQDAADAAQSTANTAVAAAGNAQNAADAAQGTADSALTAAGTAQRAADAAQGTASNALTAANAAQGAADAAQGTANTALSAANAAQGAAEAAQGTANNALTAAGTAQRAADEAKAAAGSASSQLAGIGPEETVIDRIKAVGESIAAALGGGATAADDGTLGAPAYEVAAINADGTVAAPTTHNNAGAAISALGDSIGTVNSRVDGLADDSLLWNEALGAFDASHGDQTTSKIANVAAGVSDTDAVNVSQLEAVGEVADAAQSAAVAAQGTANTALAAANTAQGAADAAQGTADNAVTTAGNAQDAADAAQGTANAALTAANTAQGTADAAQGTANSAVIAASTAQDAADAAQGTANTALAAANAAQGTADTAQNTADTALTAANTAHGAAEAAQGTANNAITAASTAQNAADAAQGTADSAKAASDIAARQLNGLAPEETVVGRIRQAVTDASQSMGDFIAHALGGGSTVDETGQPSALAYAISHIAEDGSTQPSQQPLDNVGDALSALDANVGRVNDTVQSQGVALQQVGQAVQGLRDDSLLWDESAGGFSASHGEQPNNRIVNLAAGEAATDAVNKGQLDQVASTADQAKDASDTHTRQLAGIAAGETVAARIAEAEKAAKQALADSLGGGATVNDDGTVTGPAYTLHTVGPDGRATPGAAPVGNVGSAIEQLDDNIAAVSNNVNTVAADVGTMRDQLDAGELGLVRQDPTTRDITLAKDKDGTRVDLNGTSGPRTLAGLKDGAVNETSTEAVTGAQLNTVAQRVDEVGKRTAGIATDTKGDGSDLPTVAPGSQAVAAGANAVATGTNAVASGAGSAAQGAGSVAIGGNAKASADNSVALGAGSEASRPNTVSVGSAGAERQVTNVAEATQGTDAVNLNQARQISQQSAGRVLQDANAYTDRQIGQLRQDTYSGIASAMAMAALPTASSPGRSMLAMGTSVYQGQSALAIGLSGRSEDGTWTYRASGSGNAQGNIGLSLGVGYEW
ncbi:YadA-like family protein [Pseudomonas sp. GD03944]|uniref:YadA-like family protein n=1 Tax=Pseudomonas sp. GD03944 TaxID=2975409 RepID=UPI002446FB87|nr:YadA-like family protein [Pseudomonas sp. GD03944]MDH1263151.1 YadA-like family protein [Pseudomonas sp. GD03944]